MATSVIIKPSRMTNYASAARGCLTEILSYARVGNSDELENAFARLRKNVTHLEREARLVVVKED